MSEALIGCHQERYPVTQVIIARTATSGTRYCPQYLDDIPAYSVQENRKRFRFHLRSILLLIISLIFEILTVPGQADFKVRWFPLKFLRLIQVP
jgi:hypothetical protein